MKNFDNKSGLTLIEITVVLVIVGILAAIALPNIFFNITKSQGAQALVMLDGAKSSMEAYYVLHSASTPAAGDLASAGVLTTATISGTTFTLSLPNPGVLGTPNVPMSLSPSGSYTGNNLIYCLLAVGGSSGIVFTRSTNGSWSCAAAGLYAGLC